MDIRKLPIRLLLSIAAGIAFTMALSITTRYLLYVVGIFPKIGEPEFETDLLIISLVYHSIYAVLGAIVTAKLAKEKARRAAFLLGTKEVIMWILGTILLWKHAAPWYNLTKALLGIPLAMLGWKLYTIYKKHKEQSKLEKVVDHRETAARHYFNRVRSTHTDITS